MQTITALIATTILRVREDTIWASPLQAASIA